MVLNRVESFLPIFLMCNMDDLSVILNKLQIGCIYAGTIINHLMYADDLCIFSPSVSGLRKLTNCCEKYGDIFNITYNVNKSYCMVIDNKPQTMKYTHPVILNNNVLPYTTKCKYLGHIINNNLTDDDDIARQKRCFYAHANVLARNFRFCSSGIKNVLFHSYCGSMYNACLTRSSWARPISTRCQFGARQFGAFPQFGACQFDARPFDAFYNGNRQHAAGTEAGRKRDGGTT